jgi:hypothetical protein
MPEIQILKSFWNRRPDGAWATNGLKGMTLKPKEGEADLDFFEIDEDIFLVQPNIMGTIHTFLGESIVPVVSRVHGENLLRCIGTGFFISCSGLFVTASHVITDPIDRKYGRTKEVAENVLHAPDLSFGVLIPTNPLFQRRAYILHPLEWAFFLAARRDNPLDLTGLDLKSSSDVAICKIAPRVNGPCHQPLAIIQSGIRGTGIAVGSSVSAIGYGSMQDVELEVNERGELIDDKKLRLQPHVSRGEITEYYADNFTAKDVSTPGPCFAFSAKIPGGMSGGPIFDREGIYAHGVVSKNWHGERLSYGSMLSPSMHLPIAQLGNLSLLQIQQAGTHGMAKFSGPGL